MFENLKKRLKGFFGKTGEQIEAKPAEPPDVLPPPPPIEAPPPPPAPTPFVEEKPSENIPFHFERAELGKGFAIYHEDLANKFPAYRR